MGPSAESLGFTDSILLLRQRVLALLQAGSILRFEAVVRGPVVNGAKESNRKDE